MLDNKWKQLPTNLDITREESDETFVLHSRVIPQITLQDYLERIGRYTPVSGEALLVAIIYLIRFERTNPAQVIVNRFNFHRLVLISIVCASKYVDDLTLATSCYAGVGGVTRQEIVAMESAYCRLMDYRFFVTFDEYLSACRQFVCDGHEPRLLASRIASCPFVSDRQKY
jgi:hypothetical protein